MAKQKINGLVKAGVGGAIGGALLGTTTLGLARYLVDRLVGPTALSPEDFYTFTPFETQVEYETVSFPTANGRLLTGWWLPQPASQRVVIAVSGYRGKKEDMLGISSALWRNGFNVLMFDYRAHGSARQADELITLGHQELEDLQSAIGYVRSRLAQPQLGLIGGSMGAAVVLLAAARDQQVQAVWADSAFTDQASVIAHSWRLITHLPNRPILDLAARLFERRTGYRWADFAPIAEVSRISPRPVYLVHAAGDRLVPVSHAYRLYAAANQPKELWIEEGLDHCGIYFAYREEYTRRVVAFFEQHLITTSPELELSSQLR